MHVGRRIAPLIVFAAFATILGCGKMSAGKAFDLDVGDAKHFTVDNVGGKFRVEVTSSEPINIDVVVAGQADPVLNEITAMKRPTKDKVLYQQTKTKAVSEEVTVPASQGLGVVVSGNAGPKKANVKIEVKN